MDGGKRRRRERARASEKGRPAGLGVKSSLSLSPSQVSLSRSLFLSHTLASEYRPAGLGVLALREVDVPDVLRHLSVAQVSVSETLVTCRRLRVRS